MRRQVRNQQRMWYSIFEKNAPVYAKDKDGNIIYDTMPDGTQVPRDTGKKKDTYSEPVEFLGNITSTIGEADAKPFGVDVSDYDALLYVPKGTLPLKEFSLIWYQSEPTMKNGEVDPHSANYKVARVPVSLNEVKYLLKGLT